MRWFLACFSLPDLRLAASASSSSKGTNMKGKTPEVSVREKMGIRNAFSPAKRYYVLLLLIAALSIWLRKGIPIHLIANCIFDDELFIRTARHLKAGDWLGPYDKLTLTKGVFYPLFICATRFAAIPLKIAEQAAYLAASALIAGLVRRRARNNVLALALFGLLSFNPVLWNVDLSRVIREGLYVSLSLAVVALVAVIAFPTRDGDRGLRIFQGVSLGLVGGAFWLTREEGIWLLPTLAVVVTIALVGILFPDWIPHSERGIFSRRSDHLKAIALPFAVALFVFFATDGLVAGLNYRHYRLFETNEFKDSRFLRAYGALLRIQHDEWRRYVPFPIDARQRAYSVSPAARELAPFLEGQLGEDWRLEGCKHVEIAPCSEVPAGWFVWELRDAVSLAGQDGSAVEAMRFYDRLANEIDAACDSGRIECLPPRATLLPPFRREYLWGALQSGEAAARVLFTMGDGDVGSTPSVGSQQEVDAISDIIGGDVSPASTPVVQGTQVKIAGVLASGCAMAFPFLAILGAAGLLLAILFQRQRPIPASLLALGLGSAVAVITRIALLAYIDASSFPAATLLYTSPASPFVIIFMVVGMYSAWSFILRVDQ